MHADILGRLCQEKHDEEIAVDGQNQKGDQPADDLEHETIAFSRHSKKKNKFRK